MSNDAEFLDISGYSFSGKSAFYDLLSPLQGVKGFGLECEFDLIRARGGILDLYDCLAVHWTLPRSSVAVRDFNKLVRFLGGGEGLIDRLFRGGARYDALFPGFTNFATNYIKDLTRASWNGYWPFADFCDGPMETFYKKCLERFRNRHTPVFLARTTPDDFVCKTKLLMQSLASSAASSTTKYVIISNSINPDSPDDGLQFYHKAKSIIVDRDPRDIFLAAKHSADVKVGAAAIGENVQDFVKRFLCVRSGSRLDRFSVKRIYFEQLVLDYENCCRDVALFTGLNLPDFESSFDTVFDPKKSVKNVKMWEDNRKYRKFREDISFIESSLPEYLLH